MLLHCSHPFPEDEPDLTPALDDELSASIALPVFQQLKVSQYGMYPGTASRRGLDVVFQPGMTLVLGANGLGKTTLVTMLYRLCAGPFDIPGVAGATELGTRRLDARRIPRPQRRLFATRVVDHAEDATASLRMTVGSAEIEVTRSLADLTIERLAVDGVELAPNDQTYENAVLKHVGLSSFGDWILLLRHLTFYFEDRRALVWDPSAQRQILRLLFLPPDTAADWRRRERRIVEQDSHMRNLQAILTREEGELARTEEATLDPKEARQELGLLQQLLAADEARLQTLNSKVEATDAAARSARLDAVKAEAEHESAFRNLERLQLNAVGAAFPSSQETARYLIGTLFANGECLTCGSRGEPATAGLRDRIASGHCIICDSDVSATRGSASWTSRAITRATSHLHKAAAFREATRMERGSADEALADLLSEIDAVETQTTSRRIRLQTLLRQLPPDERDLDDQREYLTVQRRRVERMKQELAAERSSFARFIKRVNRDIVKQRDDIRATFQRFAEGFLLEDCDLKFAIHKTKLGETGGMIDFPVFELEMSAPAFPSPVRRSGPTQVSESQREFVDLAFRMTLMEVAGARSGGTLVIDAPESSLDAVFVSRAADVLTAFAAPTAPNRTIVTSNLIEGDLIPELISKAGIRSASDSRVVDLLKIAAPTAATRARHSDYVAVRRRLFARSKQMRP